MMAPALMALTDLRVTAFLVIPEFFAKQVNSCFVLAQNCHRCLDIGECSSVPCQNNGTCVDEINRFTCICASGFSGLVCETSEVFDSSRA